MENLKTTNSLFDVTRASLSLEIGANIGRADNFDVVINNLEAFGNTINC